MSNATVANRPPSNPPSSSSSGRTVLARDSSISAQVRAEEIVLEGCFQGEVRARSVRVEATAEVDAVLRCESAEILGHFDGTIEARVVRFGPAAVAQGVFRVERVALAEGGIVTGSFNVEVVDRSQQSRAEATAGKETRPEPGAAAAMGAGAATA